MIGNDQSKEWCLNTSNAGKLQEFQRLFSKHRLTLKATQVDLPEIEAEPLQVIAHKASQLEDNVLVEDTSLDVEDASVGIHVRWLLDHLHEYVGKKAIWSVLLAYKDGDEVIVYRGEVRGLIVLPNGVEGFGFDPVFMPDGKSLTLAQSKPDDVNARAKAVEALAKDNRFCTVKAIDKWEGPWQKH